MNNLSCRLGLVLITVLGSLVSCKPETRSTKAYTQPNIILIMADDLGYECVGANGGSSYKTPVLDQLAQTFVTFIQN